METPVAANESSNPQLNCSLLRVRFRTVYPIDKWKSEGYFTDDDLLDIDCYWMQFEPITPAAHFILAILYVIIFIIGCTSNAIVIYILASSRKLRTPANILLINLAVSDLMLIMMIPIFVFNSFLQGPAIGKIGCYAYGFLGGFAGTSSIITLAAIAVDRFLVISRPMDKKPTRTRAYITVALIWVYAALFAGMPLVGIGKYVPEGYLTSCSFDYLSNDVWTKVFIFIFFVGAWLYPLGVISFCYVAIIWAVYHVRLNVITADGASIATPSEVSKRKRTDISVDTNTTTRRKLRSVVNQPNLELTIAKFVIGLVSMWIIAWTPYALVSLMGISGYQSLLTPFYSMVPALFAKTASCIDPFIYALNHPKIRKEIFCRLYKSFYRAGRDSMTESMRPTYDWKNGRSVTFGQPSRRYSGPSSRRLKSFPFKDDISMSDQRMIQHSAADTDGSEMKTIRDDENSMNLPQPVRKSDGGMLMKYKKRTNSLFLPTMSHKSVINQMSSL